MALSRAGRRQQTRMNLSDSQPQAKVPESAESRYPEFPNLNLEAESSLFQRSLAHYYYLVCVRQFDTS